MTSPKPELWIGYAREKATGKMVCTKQVWNKPLADSNRYGQCPPTSQTPNEIVYTPGCWAHTDGTPQIHPHESQWEFVLVRYEPS